MNDRVLQIRKQNKLSQERFGEKLGITGAAVSRIESGDRSLTEQMVKAICREFKINENWLRTGEGDMFSKPDDIYGAAIGEFIDTEDEFIKNMFIGMANMSQSDRDIIKKAIEIIKKSNIF